MRIDEITRRDLLKGAGAAALTSLAGQSKAASKWVNFVSMRYKSTPDTITSYYFDSNSVVRDGPLLKVWVKTTEDSKETAKYLWEIYPSKRLFRQQELWGNRWAEVTPDTWPDFLLDALKNKGLIEGLGEDLDEVSRRGFFKGAAGIATAGALGLGATGAQAGNFDPSTAREMTLRDLEEWAIDKSKRNLKFKIEFLSLQKNYSNSLAGLLNRYDELDPNGEPKKPTGKISETITDVKESQKDLDDILRIVRK
jgi:hypothetical protein